MLDRHRTVDGHTQIGASKIVLDRTGARRYKAVSTTEITDMSFYGITNQIEADPTPAGKRSVRRTVRGSLVGYVAGRMWANFGDAFDAESQRRADAWLAGMEA